MSADVLSAIVGIALSLALSYVPGLKDKFAQLTGDQKRAIVGGLLVVTTGAVFGLACGGVVDYVTCDQAGIVGLLEALIAALVANQSAYLMTKG